MIVAGIPAKTMRPVPHEQLLDEQNWPDVQKRA
jgi:hypothetical protein